MPRTLQLEPGDILTGNVLIFDLAYQTRVSGDGQKIAMKARVDCQGITVEELKDLMKGQGLIVRSQNNRERKLGTRLQHQSSFKGGWKDFTKSSGRVIDVTSMSPKDLTDRMTKEQMQAVYVEMNRRLNAGEGLDASLEELASAAAANADVKDEELDEDIDEFDNNAG